MSLKNNLNFVIENLNRDWEQEYAYGHWDENDNFVFHPLNANLLYEKIKETIGRTARLIIEPKEFITPLQSKLGGEPDIPENMAWPSINSQPLDFTAQINLKEIPVEIKGLLPVKGILYIFTSTHDYFVDVISTKKISPEDFTPVTWKILYSEEDLSCTRRKTPESCKTYKSCAVSFSIEEELPVAFSPEILCIKETLSNQEMEALNRFGEFWISSKIYGYPITFQDHHDLRIRTKAKEHDIVLSPTMPYEDEVGYMDDRKINIEERAKDWKLLFQLDSEMDAGMDWLDSGVIYFLIKEEDLKNRNFDRVHLFYETH